MGSKNVKAVTDLQTMVFDVFSTLKWQERIWKVFCFRFEYKYYRTDTSKYTITWEEFEGIFLDEFKVGYEDEGINLYEWIIYNTFKKIFEYNNFEIRVYRVYMFFFPYCLHLNGAEGLNFIDLLFEKIIYNLEVEMVASFHEAKAGNLDDSNTSSDEENENNYNLTTKKNPYLNNDNADKKSKKSKKSKKYENSNKRFARGIIASNAIDNKMLHLQEVKSKKNTNSHKELGIGLKTNNINADKNNNLNNLDNNNNNNDNSNNLGLPDSSRLMLNKDIMTKRGMMHLPSSAMIDEQVTGSSLEGNLLRKYNNEFNKQIQNGFVRKISFEVFKEIMFVYFQNNIVQFLKAFKEILTEFKDYEYVDDGLVYSIKDIDKNSIDLSLLTSKNIHKFLNNTYEKKLFGLRDNIKRDPNNDAETFLTFDDIYVYMKNNYYFYNCKELYYQFSRDTSF